MARKLAVLVTGAVLLVAACTTETRTTNETSSNAPEGSAASYASAPCPNPIYGAGLDLGPEFTCGYLTVPENRTQVGQPDHPARRRNSQGDRTEPQARPDLVPHRWTRRQWARGGPGSRQAVASGP